MLVSRDPSLALPQDDHRLAQLVRDCLAHRSFARLLHWLHAHPATLMTASDIGALLRLSEADTIAALQRLDAMGFLRRVTAGSHVFFGLTQDPQVCGLLGLFEGWCSTQRNTLQRLESLVGP